MARTSAALAELMDRLRFLLLTGGGTGLAPVAPGTFGTIPAFALAAGIVWLCPDWRGWAGILLLSLVLLWFGCLQTEFSARTFGSHDPGAFVLDEIVGYLLAVAIFWVARGVPSLGWQLGLFALFRFFDISKLQPARALEGLPGAAGIMLDDVAAGVWAAAAAIGLSFVAQSV